MKDEKLNKIYLNASNLFINKGFKLTQINDIAKSCNMSVGSIYNIFQSKDAILHFVIKQTIDSNLTKNLSYPIEASPIDEIRQLIFSVFENNEKLLRDKENSSFAEILKECYTILESYSILNLLIEKHSINDEEIFNKYLSYRTLLFNFLQSILQKENSTGTIVSKNPQYETEFIIETLSWWSMHRRNNCFDITLSNSFPLKDTDSLVQDLIINLIINAFKP